MTDLKLAALDADDLQVLSAQVQDAVGVVGDCVWRPKERRFTVELNRFVWESAAKRTHERRRSLLHFARVEAVKAANIRRDAPDAVISLLAIRFEPGEAPAEASLTDLGGGGKTENLPKHDLA